MCTAITAAAGPAATTNTATMVLAQQQNITAEANPQPVQGANLVSEAGNNNNNGSHRRSSSPRSSSIRRSRNGSSNGSKKIASSSSKAAEGGGSKKAKRMKKSPSTISPNSDEIRNEALAIEREHSVGGKCGRAAISRPTCAMCGSSLSKSISQASTFSNVIVERPSDSGSVQTTASAQAALQ
ncbi:PREDICTED: uncharacterized protein LOC108382563, partial [Rhagoletis zephyria]|uniref:uncharacterized protein LOC108382563 n=1 Tax=Rhagoletis zephyria TaxID=28612 RepID=UPI0008113681